MKRFWVTPSSSGDNQVFYLQFIISSCEVGKIMSDHSFLQISADTISQRRSSDQSGPDVIFNPCLAE